MIEISRPLPRFIGSGDSYFSIERTTPSAQSSTYKNSRLAEPVLSGQADLVLGSRDLSDLELALHMPAWKRVGNRALSALQNRTLGLARG